MKIDTKITISLTKEQVEHIVIEHLKQQGTIKGEVSYTRSRVSAQVGDYYGHGPSGYEFSGMEIVVSG
jgi:DNA-binding sugar fermentation-stimulating protein